MFAGTSTVPTAIWQQDTHYPSNKVVRSASEHVDIPPPPIPTALLQATTPTSSADCCTPDELIIQLSTTLVIPNYNLFYSPIPIESFRPSYDALSDGSLIAPPFIEDLTNANASLLVTGMLSMLFLRNIFVAADYLHRGKVKKRLLFYLLFASQLLAPVSFIPIIVSYFYQSLSCTLVIILSCISASISLAILITGILGIKAYKCLEKSRFVQVPLIVFQCASAAILAVDLSAMRGERRLSGSCIRSGSLRFTRVYVMIQFVESLFICSCFVFACWKSRGSPLARGRISIQLSMDDPPEAQEITDIRFQGARRGWWDYVPDAEKTTPPTNSISYPNDAVIKSLHSRLTNILGKEREVSQHIHRSSETTLPPPHAPRPSTVRISESPPRLSAPPPESFFDHGRTSPVPSSFSRLSRLVPRMGIVRAALRDELIYTTFITATCVVVAVLAVIGLNFKNGLTVTGWISLNWGVISVLAIHSFGRVVNRIEKDALLQHPSTQDAIIRAAQLHAHSDARRYRSRRPWSLASLPSHSRFRNLMSQGEDPGNPYSDTRPLSPSRTSWNSAGFVPTSPLGSTPTSPIISVQSFFKNRANVSGVLPSPLIDTDFPTSGRVTPLVPHDSSDGTLIQNFSQSWLFEHSVPPKTSSKQGRM